MLSEPDKMSRWLGSLARGTLVGVVAVSSLAWWQLGAEPWAGAAAGMLCVFVLWLLSRIASGQRTMGGHPIFPALAVVAGILFWHLAETGLRKSHPDLSGELTVSMLFQISLAAVGVLVSRELFGPRRGRWAPAICGAAMLAGSVCVLWWLPEDTEIPRLPLALLGLTGGALWLADPPRRSGVIFHGFWALAIAVPVVSAAMLAPAAITVTSLVWGGVFLLSGVLLPARRKVWVFLGVVFCGVGGAVLACGARWPLPIWSGSWTALGWGEQAANRVYAGNSGLEILPAVVGWVGTLGLGMGALGTLVYLLFRARQLDRGRQRSVVWCAVAVAASTGALLAPGGAVLACVTVAVASGWGMLAARANPHGHRWPGWLLLPAAAAVLLGIGLAGKPGLAQWAVMTFQDDKDFLHGPTGLLVGLLLGWLLGARRWWLGVIGIAIAAGLGALGEVAQGVVSHVETPIASTGRLPELQDFWYHLIGCGLALVLYLLLMGARLADRPAPEPATDPDETPTPVRP